MSVAAGKGAEAMLVTVRCAATLAVQESRSVRPSVTTKNQRYGDKAYGNDTTVSGLCSWRTPLLSIVIGSLTITSCASLGRNAEGPLQLRSYSSPYDTGGAAARLQEDLAERFPAGSPLQEVISYIEGGGADCAPSPTPPDTIFCEYLHSTWLAILPVEYRWAILLYHDKEAKELESISVGSNITSF